MTRMRAVLGVTLSLLAVGAYAQRDRNEALTGTIALKYCMS